MSEVQAHRDIFGWNFVNITICRHNTHTHTHNELVSIGLSQQLDILHTSQSPKYQSPHAYKYTIGIYATSLNIYAQNYIFMPLPFKSNYICARSSGSVTLLFKPWSLQTYTAETSVFFEVQSLSYIFHHFKMLFQLFSICQNGRNWPAWTLLSRRSSSSNPPKNLNITLIIQNYSKCLMIELLEPQNNVD